MREFLEVSMPFKLVRQQNQKLLSSETQSRGFTSPLTSASATANRYAPCAWSKRSRKFFAQERNAASISPHFLNPLRPLNHLRPPLLVTNATIRSPEVESSISPSIPALPTLSLATNKLAPGATPTVAAVAAPFTAAFFLPPVGSTFVIATFTSRTSGPGVVTIWYCP